MTQKFKVGDRVEVLPGCPFNAQPGIARVMRLSRVNDKSCPTIDVHKYETPLPKAFDGIEDLDQGVHPDFVRLAPAYKFKVGDKVTHIDWGLCTVRKVDALDPDGLIYFVDGGDNWCSESDLTLAHTPQNPNPKKAFGAQKPDLALIPPVANLHMAMAFENGAAKYNAFNWRVDPVEAMTYIAAAKRHLDLFLDGQDYSSDAVVHNLGHVMACCAIVIDSQEQGILIDNRPPPGRSEEVQQRLKAQKVAAAAKVAK